MVFVITGNPGVGKHTVGKKIAEMLNLEPIDLNKIAVEEKMFEEGEESKDVYIEELKKYLKTRIDKKSLVIGHLAPYVLTRSQVERIIVLRKNPYKLSQIYQKRGYSQRKIKENIEGEILGIIAHDAIKRLGGKKIVQIDTSEKSIQNVVMQTVNAIRGKKETDEVDWLNLVSENDDLRRFFSYD